MQETGLLWCCVICSSPVDQCFQDLVFITDSVFGLAFSHLPKIYIGSVYSERKGNVSEVGLLMKPACQFSIFMVTSIV